MSAQDNYMKKRAAARRQPAGQQPQAPKPFEPQPFQPVEPGDQQPYGAGGAAGPTTRMQQDQQMFEAWKAAPSPQTMESLLDRLRPTIVNAQKRLTGARRIPDSALEKELERTAIQAIHSYDPSRGTSLNTHVTNHLPRGLRYVRKHQNMFRMAEDHASMIRPLQQAKDDLHNTLGRAPSNQEIAEHMNSQDVQFGTGQRKKAVTPKLVGKWLSMDRADVADSTFEGEVGETTIQRHQDLIPMIRVILSRDETPKGQLVLRAYDRVYGLGEHENNPAKTMGQAAKDVGVSQSQLSKIFTPIKKMFDDNG